MESIERFKSLSESHGLEFKDCGNGHIQVKGHGVCVNYWPNSKAKKAHIANGAVIPNCTPFDVVKLCMQGATVKNVKLGVKKKHISKNGPDFDHSKKVRTNPAGVKHFYNGAKPPWGYPSMIMCQSDRLRIIAYKITSEAEEMDSVNIL